MYNKIYHLDSAENLDIASSMPLSVMLCSSYIRYKEQQAFLHALEEHDKSNRGLILCPSECKPFLSSFEKDTKLKIVDYPDFFPLEEISQPSSLRKILVNYFLNGSLDNSNESHKISIKNFTDNQLFEYYIHEVNSINKWYNHKNFCQFFLWKMSRIEWLMKHDPENEASEYFQPLWEAFQEHKTRLYQESQNAKMPEGFNTEQATLKLLYGIEPVIEEELQIQKYKKILENQLPTFVTFWNKIVEHYGKHTNCTWGQISKPSKI